LQVLERLLPLVDKKRGQVEGAIRYLEDEITANQLVDVFNMAIKQSKRRPPKGKAEFEIPKIPFTRSKGRKMARSFSASKQKFKLKARFTADEIEQIKKDVLIRGIPSEVVALNHGLSGRSVRRLVRGTR